MFRLIRTIQIFVRRNGLQAAIVLFFVLVAGYGILGIHNRLDHDFNRQAAFLHRRDDKTDYLAVINSPAEPDATKAEALLHLAVHDSNDAYYLARKWIHAKDPSLVKAAIETLRFSSDKSDENILFTMYADLGTHPTNRKYRQILVSSLAYKPGDLNSLKSMLDMPWTNPLDKIILAGAIYRKEKNEDERRKILARLKNTARDSKGDLKAQAILELNLVSPRDPDVIDLLIRSVKFREQEILPYALMQLATVKNPWLLLHFRALLNSRDPSVQSSTIQVLTLFCPENVFPQLEKIYFTTDDIRMRRTILSAVARYRSQTVQSFIRKALAAGNLTSAEVQSLRNRVVQVQSAEGAWCID